MRHTPARDLVQFPVDERNQPVESGFVAPAPLFQ
jgi:hypothetical protein